ncbi:MAG: signal peptidase II [Proteobacteria bacterium]|nr:signal peptidase II [Pseudomonadota bacterium]
MGNCALGRSRRIDDSPSVLSCKAWAARGSIGNVIDRFRFGAVADFLDFHWGGYHWPAFNLADAAISIGVVILLLDALLIGDERHK